MIIYVCIYACVYICIYTFACNYWLLLYCKYPVIIFFSLGYTAGSLHSYKIITTLCDTDRLNFGTTHVDCTMMTRGLRWMRHTLA